MKLGELGQQFCIKSKEAFNKERFDFITAHGAAADRFYKLRDKRRKTANKAYWDMADKESGNLIIDLIGR